MSRTSSGRRVCRYATTLAASVLTVASLAAAVAAAEPKSSIHRPFPIKDLYGYVEYDGLDSRTDAWRKTAAYAILNETSLGTVLSKMGYHVLDKPRKQVAAPTAELLRTQIASLYAHILHRGFSGGFYERDDGVLVTVLAFRGLGQKEVREKIAAAFATLDKLGDPPAILPAKVIRGRQTFHYLVSEQKTKGNHEHGPADDRGGSDAATCWFEGEDVIVVSTRMSGLAGEAASKKSSPESITAVIDSVLDTIEGKQPNVESHRSYIAALHQGEDLKGFAPNGLFFSHAVPGTSRVDPARKPSDSNAGASSVDGEPKAGQPAAEPMPREGKAKGGELRSLGRWGFQGKALLTDLRIEAAVAAQERLGAPGLSPTRLGTQPLVRRGATEISVVSMNATEFALPLAGFKPNWAPSVETAKALFSLAKKGLEPASDVNFSRDLLDHLGPCWCIYKNPVEQGARKAATAFRPSDFTLVAGVNNAAEVARALDRAVEILNKDPDGLRNALRSAAPAASDKSPAKKAATSKVVLERLPEPERGMQLVVPDGLVAGWEPGQRPTLLVGKSSVVVASSLALAREALAAEENKRDRWTPSGELQEALGGLPERVTMLVVSDGQSRAWSEALCRLPGRLGASEDTEQSESRFLTPDGIILGDESMIPSLSFLGVLEVTFEVRAEDCPGLEPAARPTAADLRARLFPPVWAVTQDARGYRVITREALPFQCLETFTWLAMIRGGPAGTSR